MVSFINQIELIRNILKQNGYEEVAEMILEAQLSAGTPGEILEIACSKLLGLKAQNKKAYAVISKEAKELISYANSIGYHPSAT